MDKAFLLFTNNELSCIKSCSKGSLTTPFDPVGDCGQVGTVELSTDMRVMAVSFVYRFIHRQENMWISCWQVGHNVRRITFLNVDKV